MDIRFLAQPAGFEKLNKNGFLENEINLWYERLNVEYMQSLEAKLSERLTPIFWKQTLQTDQFEKLLLRTLTCAAT